MAKEKIKILIAEDDSFLAQMYSEKLEKEGIEVILATNGVEAIDKMKIEMPDLLLLDLLMPKKNGFEVLQEKLSDEKIRDIPVIVLTNLSQKEDIKKCYDLGAREFMIKAYFIPSEIIDKIKKLLNVE
ncbi:MAG TPA: response regulator [bacterium]|jgi:CheY-like chemotaxis protein|nr:response regulator [bacterium]HOG38112.1 response regulator [bacterium]HQI03168.1 response regulator [bacterium]